MYRLDNRVQEYAWGSRTAIALLLGRPVPSAHPQAELWLGAHPSLSSRAERDGRWESLFDVISNAPLVELGPKVVSKFGPSLPFLFKVLAAERPLSLQAHPDREQAEAGFEAEERARTPIDAPHRNYKDRNHKPELVCALERFELLSGFRTIPDTVRFLRSLHIEALADGLSALEREPGRAGLRKLVAWLFAAKEALRADLVGATLRAAAHHVGSEGEFARECGWILRIGTLYPDDIGVTIALLLNLVTLEAGEAIYLPAGNLHTYLKGVGLEIMANSDNVLRGGLTPKHVDAKELLRVLTFEDGAATVLSPRGDGLEKVYESPAPEFRLSRIVLDRSPEFRSVDRLGPEILLCVEGSVSIESSHASIDHRLERGASVFVAASSGSYTLNGRGTVFRATVGAV